MDPKRSADDGGRGERDPCQSLYSVEEEEEEEDVHSVDLLSRVFRLNHGAYAPEQVVTNGDSRDERIEEGRSEIEMHLLEAK